MESKSESVESLDFSRGGVGVGIGITKFESRGVGVGITSVKRVQIQFWVTMISVLLR